MRQKKAQEKKFFVKQSNRPVSANKLSYNPSETIKFNKSDIVWAKITGYPWWPAIVTTVPGQKDIDKRYDDMRNNYPWSNVHHNVKAEYRVDFIADQTHAFLKKNFLLNYLQNRDRLYVEGLQFSSRKRRYFQMAVNEADQLQQVLLLSKNQIQQNKTDKLEQQSDSIESESNSQMNEQQEQNDQESQNKSQNSSQNQSTPQNRVTRLKKLKANQIKKEQESISISNHSRSHTQKRQCFKKAKLELNKNDQVQTIVLSATKRGRPFKRPNKINQIDTKSEFSHNRHQNQCKKDLFVKFQICQKDIALISKKQFQEKQLIFFQFQAPIHYQNEGNIVGAQKCLPQFNSNEAELENKKTQQLLSDLLIKYNLHIIDEVQENFKNYKKLKNEQQNIQFFENSNSFPIKPNNNKVFIKSIFNGLGKKKHSRKNIHQKTPFCENDIFSEKLSIIGKIKQNDQEKISYQLKKFLIETSKKYTAKKMYLTVLNILKKNSLETPDQQIQTSIRQKCKNISNILFTNNQIEKYTNQYQLGYNSKKKQKSNEGNNFVSILKKKLEQNVSFIRFFSMQNWDLLARMSQFSSDLSIQIKSFQIYLEKNCHLIMRNQQKIQDIVKQINIENQKTSFTHLHPPNEMQIESESPNTSSNKFISVQDNQCIKLGKKVESIFIQNK